jgi:aryl-alcohol dehydrogenase-like predicted oxidoreductase
MAIVPYAPPAAGGPLTVDYLPITTGGLTMPGTTTALPTARLGRTDMAITRLGFGAWAVGGGEWSAGWGAQDDAASIAAIRRAIDAGVNWIDTAAAYGLGHSEDVVRQALAGLPANDRPFVFTKCGLVWEGTGRDAPLSRVAAPASIKREAEASLKRLGADRIDLLQLHWPPSDGTPIEVYWQAFQDLKRDGKIRYAGLSNHSAVQLEAAERIAHVDSLQPPFSAIRRDFAGADLSWCRAHGTGVIVYSPMQAGLLTGTFSPERARALPDNDWRSRGSEFAGEKLKRNLQLADALRPIAARHATSVASVAIAWTLAWPGVTAAIVGARTPGQVDGWIDAASVTLTVADLAEIAAAIEATGAGKGPTKPE